MEEKKERSLRVLQKLVKATEELAQDMREGTFYLERANELKWRWTRASARRDIAQERREAQAAFYGKILKNECPYSIAHVVGGRYGRAMFLLMEDLRGLCLITNTALDAFTSFEVKWLLKRYRKLKGPEMRFQDPNQLGYLAYRWFRKQEPFSSRKEGEKAFWKAYGKTQRPPKVEEEEEQPAPPPAASPNVPDPPSKISPASFIGGMIGGMAN